METIESPLVGLVVRIIDEQQKEQKFGKVGNAVSYFEATKEVAIDIDSKGKASYKIVVPESSIQDTATVQKKKRRQERR